MPSFRPLYSTSSLARKGAPESPVPPESPAYLQLWQISETVFRESPLHKNAPLFAAVESDVVGYTTIEMQAGKWYQIGNPFVALEDGTVPTLNTVFTDGFADGDTLYVLPLGQATYLPARVWISDYQGQTGWFNLSDRSYDMMELSVGQAVFIKKATHGEVTLKGRVSAKEIVPITGETWTQLVCVYPKECSLNELSWQGIETGDKVYIYDSVSGNYLPERMWLTYNGQTGWFNLADRSFDTQKLPVGQALFVNKASANAGSVQVSVD